MYLSRAVEEIDAAFLYRTPDAAVPALGDARYAAAQHIVLCRKLPRLEGRLALVQLEQSFLVAADPQVVVFVLEDMVDVGRGQVVLGGVAGHLLQRLAAFGDDEQSAPRRTEIDVAGMVDERSSYRHLAVERTHVVAGVGQFARGIVVAQDAVHADGQESPAVAAQEPYYRSVGRLVVLMGCRLQSAHLDAAEHRGLVASPDVVLVVFEDGGEEVVVLALRELHLAGDAALSGTNGEQSVARRADEQVAVGILQQALHAWLQTLGKGIAHKAVFLVVEAR